MNNFCKKSLFLLGFLVIPSISVFAQDTEGAVKEKTAVPEGYVIREAEDVDALKEAVAELLLESGEDAGFIKQALEEGLKEGSIILGSPETSGDSAAAPVEGTKNTPGVNNSPAGSAETTGHNLATPQGQKAALDQLSTVTTTLDVKGVALPPEAVSKVEEAIKSGDGDRVKAAMREMMEEANFGAPGDFQKGDFDFFGGPVAGEEGSFLDFDIPPELKDFALDMGFGPSTDRGDFLTGDFEKGETWGPPGHDEFDMPGFDFDQKYFDEFMTDVAGHVAEALREEGIDPRDIGDMMDKYGIEDFFKEGDFVSFENIPGASSTETAGWSGGGQGDYYDPNGLEAMPNAGAWEGGIGAAPSGEYDTYGGPEEMKSVDFPDRPEAAFDPAGRELDISAIERDDLAPREIEVLEREIERGDYIDAMKNAVDTAVNAAVSGAIFEGVQAGLSSDEIAQNAQAAAQEAALEILAGGLAAAAAVQAPAPAEQPAAEQPAQEQPPAQEVQVEQVIVFQEVVAGPAPEQPAQEQPAQEQPPAEEQPVQEQPAQEVQVEQVIVFQEVVAGPQEQPPAEQPPAEQPPAEQPPAESPPAEQPPAEQPPAEQPPAESPPPAAEAPPPPPPAGSVAGGG